MVSRHQLDRLSQLRQSGYRYAMLAPLALLLFQLVYSGCRSNPTPDSLPTSDAKKTVVELAQNQRVVTKLSGDEIHAYQISLLNNQYLRVVVNKPKAVLTARLMDPDGQTLEEHTIRCYGILPLSFISQTAGTFTLEMQTAQKQEDAPSYEIIVEQAQEVSPRDDDRIRADKAFTMAEKLREEWNQESFDRALSQYAHALEYWEGLNEQYNQAMALLSIAELYYLSGKNREALDYYNRAIAPSQNSQQKRAEIEALNGMGAASIELGNIADARQHGNLALDLSQNAGDIPGEAMALNNIGLAHYLAGELQEAIGYFERSLTMGRMDADPRSQAQALIYLGYAYQDFGDLQKASSHYSGALTFWKAINDRRQEGFTLTAIGNIYSFRNEKQEALKHHRQAADIFQQMGDPNGEAAALNGLGYVYSDLGEGPKALTAFGRSLRLSRLSGNRDFECQTLGYIGRVYHASGDRQTALEFFRQRLKLSRQIGDRRLEAHTLRDIGSTLSALNRKGDALRHYEQALALSRRVTDRRGQAFTLDYIGYIHDTSGKKRNAIKYYLQALSLMRAVGDNTGETLTLYNIARANRDIGDFDDARLNIEEALKKVESLRTKVINRELRTSYFASVHQYYELYIDVLMHLHRRNPLQGLDVIALAASEKARARTLVDSLAESNTNIREGVDPELLEKERALQQLLDAAVERRMRILSGDYTTEQAERIEQEINQLADEFKEVQVQISDKSPRYSALTQPVPLSVSKIQQGLLDSDTTLLEYSLGDRASYLWAVTPNSIESYQLPSRRIIEGLCRRAYDLITAQQALSGETLAQYRRRVATLDAQYWRLASRLSRILLAPASAQLSNRRLLIVAEGALQHFPFSSLPAPEALETPALIKAKNTNRVTPLIVEHEVVSLPSISTLEALRRELGEREPSNNRIAVFADPVFTHDDPRVQVLANSNQPPPELSEHLSRALSANGRKAPARRIPRLPFDADRSEGHNRCRCWCRDNGAAQL